ncbi:aldose 1-epimerase family protein [Candidatus Epulonipiscium viviparus]|uniref:aldose 1-epimerase family protein n=1 Tax=Candidatus Epulonipiscium viviparus TaxID=420336 RepID=UPI0027381182|nr:aldose 1-epimerase family protein [Candidatus Epulopiscium viviparus]
MVVLQNNKLTAKFKLKGAELTSLVNNEGIEYIWCGDKTYWEYQAPILFPIVGRIVDDEYIYERTTYPMPSHGFARHQTFDVIEQTETSVTFELRASEETKRIYPFEFVLNIIYTLNEDTLDTKYVVKNMDSKKMAFKIGAHPAIRCPLLENEQFDDYKITFDSEESTTTFGCSKNGYADVIKRFFKGTTIHLSHQLLHERVIIFEGLKSSKMTLHSNKNKHEVIFDITNFPYVALWSPDAPFICFEPWYGHADFVHDSKELINKSTALKLMSQKQFECVHKITIK